jgi:hypothetical protein
MSDGLATVYRCRRAKGAARTPLMHPPPTRHAPYLETA